jgi:hypothetical protein
MLGAMTTEQPWSWPETINSGDSEAVESLLADLLRRDQDGTRSALRARP